jgi:hypothetical protein
MEIKNNIMGAKSRIIEKKLLKKEKKSSIKGCCLKIIPKLELMPGLISD